MYGVFISDVDFDSDCWKGGMEQSSLMYVYNELKHLFLTMCIVHAKCGVIHSLIVCWPSQNKYLCWLCRTSFNNQVVGI